MKTVFVKDYARIMFVNLNSFLKNLHKQLLTISCYFTNDYLLIVSLVQGTYETW